MSSFSILRALHNKFHVTKQQSLSIQRYVYDGSSVRVRFAPSPTGFLHIGGLRTALYNYLFAKSHENGKFIVRIEDTDQTRVVPGAAKNLLSTLEWVGITPDESPEHGGNYGPYLQSDRLDLYQMHAQELIDNGSAYHCFCSHLRLSLLKRDQKQRRETVKYDNRCRHLSDDEIEHNLNEGKPYVVRLKLHAETQEIDDELFGRVSHNVGQEGDPVLLKSDGFPTYHLGNVIDDHHMEITHVIRGKEWLTSTPKHVLIYNAFGWTPPAFLHLPLLINPDGTKLSKRQGDVYVEQYKERGFSPSSLINFMSYYGSGFTGVKFPMCKINHNALLQDLTQAFDAQKLLQSDAIVDFTKLEEFSRTLNCHLVESGDTNIRKQLVHELFDLVLKKYGKECIFCDESFTGNMVRDRIKVILETRKNHIFKLNDLVSIEYDYLWTRPTLEEKYDLQFDDVLNDTIIFLKDCNWSPLNLQETSKYFTNAAQKYELKFPQLMKFLRAVLSGRKEGPAVVEMMFMLNKKETLHRLSHAKQQLSRSS